MHTRRHIKVVITQEDVVRLSTKIRDINVLDVTRFYPKEVNLIGAGRDWETETVSLYLTHPEFDVVPEGSVCPRFYVYQAKVRYPFLFAPTNPLLYRKFYSTWKPKYSDHWHWYAGIGALVHMERSDIMLGEVRLI